MTAHRSTPWVLAAAAVLAAATAAAQQPPPPGAQHAPPRRLSVGPQPPSPPPLNAPVPHTPTLRGPVHLDQRYHHDQYYPAAGFAVSTLPVGAVSIGWHDGSWYFHGGVWFRPQGARFVVTVPPPGIVAPALPPSVVPLWIAGVPYYYVNGVYYSAVPQGYAVVTPPPGADVAQPLPAPPSFIVYPRNGQSSAQSEADRAACNQWASAQPDGDRDASVFQRAFEACMDGRGYSVR